MTFLYLSVRSILCDFVTGALEEGRLKGSLAFLVGDGSVPFDPDVLMIIFLLMVIGMVMMVVKTVMMVMMVVMVMVLALCWIWLSAPRSPRSKGCQGQSGYA